MRRSPRLINLLPLLLVTALAACGDDGGGDDGPERDAAVSGDAGGDRDGAALDAPTAGSTACPPTPGLSCVTATEICVVNTPVGPSETSACEPVPDGCDADRTCDCAGDELCTGAFDTCSDGPAENTITCECPECQ